MRKFRRIKILLSAQKLTSLILILCVAVSYFAMQIIIAPSEAMTDEIRLSPMTDSYSLDFSENGISEYSVQLLIELFSGHKKILGQSVVSGFYGSFFEDQPTILGVKNCGNNTWYVQAEGRYFSEAEESEGTDVAIISRYYCTWNDFDIELHTVNAAGNYYRIVGLGEFTSPAQFFIGKQAVYQKLSQESSLQERLDEAFANHAQHDDIEALQDKIRLTTQTILIPYTAYEQKQLVPTVVCIMFSGKFEKKAMQQELKDSFPEAIVTVPPDAEQLMATTLKEETITGFALSLCCLLFLHALFAFWIDRNRYVLKSYRVVGGSEKKLRNTIDLSWLCILLAGYIVSLVLSRLCSGFFNSLEMNIHLQPSYHAILFFVPAVFTLSLMRISLTNHRWKEILR